ncbi:uncharacterized protein LOC141678683 isoform X2 [Apium graveolens]|uniref:uncharacterized protein LOC141678683 isoform X2 n=1 Tax=Apium graveolens TaxID=4045 RepID=UPI003D7B903E
MGLIEDTHKEDNVSDSETEFMDTQSSLDGSGSFDNTVPFEDAVTQVVCLAGETQVLDFDCETQAVENLDCAEDFCTQLCDDFDTEVVVDTDDEGTKQIEVLNDTEELSDVDSLKKVSSYPVELENIMQTAMHKQSGIERKDIPTTEECNKGPVLRGFTSLRVASVRSAGLAARQMALRRTKSASCFNVTENQHEAGNTGTSIARDLYDFDRRYNLEEHDHQAKGLSSENKCRAGNSAVRKLFNEDTSQEKGLDEYMNNTDKEAMPPPVCTNENDLAGLSYIDSQDPGEASQSIALNFVEKFLKVNVTEFDQEPDIIKSTGGKSKVLSGAKGTQSFAKHANRNYLASGGIYDWDDNQEDEGGGEFFRKKKETFFDDGCKRHKSLTQPRDSKHCNVKKIRAVKGNTKRVVHEDINSNVPDLVHSDSKLLLQKYKKNDKLMKAAGQSIGKNLIKELDDSIDRMVETGIGKDNLDMQGIGIDTQLAAEAMETLCCGVGVTDCKTDVANQGAQIHLSSSARVKLQKKSESDKCLLQKNASRPLKSRVSTIQAIQTKRSSPRLTKWSSTVSEQDSKKTRKQRDADGDFCNLYCDLVEENLNETESENCDISEAERCHNAAAICQKTVKNRFIEEHLSIVSPIACRTRQKTSNQTQRDTNTTTNLRERMDSLNDPISSKRKRRRTSSNTDARKKAREFEFIPPAKLKEPKATHIEQSDLEISGTSTVQKEKVCQKLPEEKINGKSNTNLKISQVISGTKRTTRSSVVCSPALPSVDRQSGKSLAKDTSVVHNPIDQNGTSISKDSSVFLTPIRCTTPVNEASPICMGDEYHARSRRKNLLRSPLKKEFCRTTADGPESAYAWKYLGKGRDITQLLVLFSQHLDGDTVKQQKKGRKVFITRNTKPSKDILAGLVKAVHGVAVERIGRSALKDERIPSDLIVLSCEEDYADCVPFLEKGASIYSSELLLNGIVIQKLEYERYRLFVDNVRKTRSTIWIRKDGELIPVTKCK